MRLTNFQTVLAENDALTVTGCQRISFQIKQCTVIQGTLCGQLGHSTILSTPNKDNIIIYKTCKHQNSKYRVSLCSQNFRNGVHSLRLNNILLYCPRLKTMIKNKIEQIARFLCEKSYNDYIVRKKILVRTIKKIIRVQIPICL